MQLLADIIKKLIKKKIIKFDDLYSMKESNVIEFIENSDYKEIFYKWKVAKKVFTSNIEPKGVYYVHHGSKVRYINPIVNKQRTSSISKKAKYMIANNLSCNMDKYIYLDFNID